MHKTDAVTTEGRGINREEWLTEATDLLRPMFKRAGFTIPEKVYVSVGWPSTGGTRKKNMTIGQAWSPDNSADKTGHIFISPVLGDSIKVLETHVHELGHLAVGLKHGHKGPFVRFCKKIGLEGKPTATSAGDALKEQLSVLIDALGDYPHGALAPGERKVQGTRLLKVLCPDCGYVVRVTRKWLDEGYPVCPTCYVSMTEDEMIEADETLSSTNTTIEYDAHGGRFKVVYHKRMKDKKLRESYWLVTDFEASGEGWEAPRLTRLATRDDVISFIQAVLEGVYSYDEPEIIDDFEDDDEVEGEYLNPDEEEELDNPDEFDPDSDEYPRLTDEEPIELLPGTVD